MKLNALLAAAFAALMSLTACGGGASTPSDSAGNNPPALTKTDTVVGTGTEAVAGKTATVTYSGYLYASSVSNHKGAKFDSGSFSFKLGSGSVITGFDAGVTGMKVGGKRTIEIPSSQGYGASGTTGIPPNSGLVFDVELTAVQ